MGKSATGKDHFYKALLEMKNLALLPLVIYTTRPMRSNEENGREYFFVSNDRLEELRESGRIIEERTYQTSRGPWTYFTADEGQIRPDQHDYLGIGTLESFVKMKKHFGEDRVKPIYIETEDGIRLTRALGREKKQKKPDYAEMCRRFLADTEDFSEEKLKTAGITGRYYNNSEFRDCLRAIARGIRKDTKGKERKGKR